MADRRISEVILKYQVDDSSLNKLGRATTPLEQGLARTEQAARSSIQELLRYGQAVDRLAASSGKLSGLQSRLKASEAQLKANAKAADELRSSLDGATRSQAGQSQTPGARGILTTAGRLAGGIGLGGASDVLGPASQVTALIDELGGSLGGLAKFAAPAAAGVVAVSIAMGEFNNQLKPSRDALDSALASLSAYYSAIQSGTRDTIKKQLNDLKAQQAAVDAELANIQNARDKAFQAEQKNRGDLAARALIGVGDVTGQFKAVSERSDELTKSQITLAGQIAGLELALGSAGVAANTAADEEKKLANERAKALDDSNKVALGEIESRRRIEAEINKFARTGTSTGLKDRIQQLNDDFARVQQQLADAQALPETEAQIAAVNRYKAELTALEFEYEKLRQVARPAIEAREREAEAIKSLTGALNGVGGAASRAGTLVDGIAKALGESADKAKTAQDKADKDLLKLGEDYLQKRAEIEKSYADDLIKLAANAAQEAAKRLRELEDEQRAAGVGRDRDIAATGRKLVDDQLTARIEAQREETKALADHLRNLERIRKDAQEREFQLALNRDFAGLFFSRRDTTRQLDQANSDFGFEQQQRQTELNNRLIDLQRAAQIEQRERQIQYQQQLADLKVRYETERREAAIQFQQQQAEARARRDAELAEARITNAAKVAEQRRALQEELGVIRQGLGQRIQAEVSAQRALIDGARGAANVIGGIFNALKSLVGSGGKIKAKAMGGPLSVGDLAWVNEPGSSGQELLRSSGHQYQFPGPGLFLSFQPSYVDANRGGRGANINMPINITGAADPASTAAAVRQQVVGILSRIFD